MKAEARIALESACIARGVHKFKAFRGRVIAPLLMSQGAAPPAGAQALGSQGVKEYVLKSAPASATQQMLNSSTMLGSSLFSFF